MIAVLVADHPLVQREDVPGDTLHLMVDGQMPLLQVVFVLEIDRGQVDAVDPICLGLSQVSLVLARDDRIDGDHRVAQPFEECGHRIVIQRGRFQNDLRVPGI